MTRGTVAQRPRAAQARGCRRLAGVARAAAPRGCSLRRMTIPSRRRASPTLLLPVCMASLLLECLVARVAAAPAPHLPRAGERFVGAIRAGFEERVVADSLDSPVSMALAPDGRVFVCEQAGGLRVVRNGRLLARPFVTVPT